MLRHALLGIALAIGPACAPTVPAEYARHRATAERAYVHGRYDEAARLWIVAAEAAESPADRDEARYRSAVSLERARRLDAARSAYARIAGSTSDRAPRAALDRALLERSVGNRRAARRWLDRVVQDHPGSWAATRAVELRVKDASSPDALETYLSELWTRLGDGPLRERVGYELARALEQRGALEAAQRQYAAVAARFPYPRGALWDDAMVRAARLESRLGRNRAAIARLDALLEHREASVLQGSYERPRYAEARFLIGELYRDALDDPARAREAFLRLWRDHDTSRLRDDAKWEAAIIAVRMGQQATACSDLRELAREMPTSRYVACAPLLCPSLGSGDGSCHDYIARRLSDVPGDAAALEPSPPTQRSVDRAER